LEFFRADAIRGSLLALSTSQWISLLLAFSALVGGIMRMRAGHAKKQGFYS
jgi:hypothetical protein